MRRWWILLAGLLAATGVGCVEPDLGRVPLYCNPGEPHCPRGYRCERYQGRDYCVREGVEPEQVVGPSSDGG